MIIAQVATVGLERAAPLYICLFDTFSTSKVLSRDILVEQLLTSRCIGQYYCGGGDLLTYYVWDGPEPLYNFNFPQGTAAGEYSLLIGGLTVPLITAQVITGKVTFVQKTQQGFDNGTGVYELDLSLVDHFNLAWREM